MNAIAISEPTRPTNVSFRSALTVAVGTSALFLVFYGGAAALTSHRSDVDTWYYAWERWIPFVPIMIVPYMSIDAFFFAAPFCCRDRRELRTLAWQLSLIVILAALAFIIYPLQLAAERPVATGFFGEIYNLLTAMDKPYNLCPSMHIALRTVLAAHFGRHCRGPLRVLMHVWFFLIGCSTLLLYQHHFIDVVGGFVLAVAVMYAFDGQTWKTPVVAVPKLAATYGFAALLLMLPMLADSSMGWWVLWPAIACGVVAAGYAGLGPSIYRLQNGRISWPAKIILGPVLVAQRLSWWHYSRQTSPANEIADLVWIGRWSPGGNVPGHLDAPEPTPPFVAIVNLCVCFDAARRDDQVKSQTAYLHLPVLDLTPPTSQQLCAAVEFIERHRRDGKVLIHCKAGFSRSAAVAAAWLVATGRAPNAPAAFNLLRDVRPQIVVRPEIASLVLEPS